MLNKSWTLYHLITWENLWAEVYMIRHLEFLHSTLDHCKIILPLWLLIRCVTCGLDCNFCPGHVGHIELTAPVYNPFLIKYLYKLLKSMCLSCHRLRINPKKYGLRVFLNLYRVEVFVMCLKLLKTGQVVASQRVKQYFMQAAKDVQLLSEQ